MAPAPGEIFLDGTTGAGGHAAEIAARIGPRGLLVCADADPSMLEIAAPRLSAFPWVRLVRADFADLDALREAAGGRTFDGALLDLGISSLQLDDPARGFSFRVEGPLDMRRDPDGGGADGGRDPPGHAGEGSRGPLLPVRRGAVFPADRPRGGGAQEKGPDPDDHRARGTGFLGDPPESLATGHSPGHEGVPGAADRREPGAFLAGGVPRRDPPAPLPRGAGGGDQFPLAGGSHGENGVPAAVFRSGR